MRPNLQQIKFWLLALFLFLLPWQTRWIIRGGVINDGAWEYGTLGIYATEILLWVILILGAKKIIAQFKQIKKWPRLWLVMLVVWIFLSIVWSPAPAVAALAALHIVESILLILLLASETGSFYILATAFVAGIVIQALLGLAQVGLQWVHPSSPFGIAEQNPAVPGTSVVEVGGNRFLRAYGGLPHPNILGGYLVAAIGVLTALIIRNTRRSRHFLMLGLVILFSSVAFFTFSRSAWLALLVLLTWFVFIFQKHQQQFGQPKIYFWRWWQIIMMVVVVALTFGFLFRETVSGRFLGGSRLEQISSQERVVGFSEGLTLVINDPILGVGIGNVTAALAEKFPGREAWAYQPTHNTPLLIAAEIGFIGLLLVLFLFYQFIMKFDGLSREEKDLEKRLSWYPFYASFIGFLIISLFDHYPWSLYSGLVLGAVLLGFLLNQAKNN